MYILYILPLTHILILFPLGIHRILQIKRKTIIYNKLLILMCGKTSNKVKKKT